MSAKTPTEQAAGSEPAAAREPKPWQSDEDAAGWRTTYRGTGRRRPVPITVEVELDDAQSEWVKEEARRARLDFGAVIRRAVDQAREADQRSNR